MKNLLTFIAIVLVTIINTTALAQSPVPDGEWTPSARLWLARSLLGEVGWNRPGEYAAVAWVYSTRRGLSKTRTFEQTVRRYSAAIRSPGLRRQPWIGQLVDGLIRPSNWPDGPQWNGLHDRAWMNVIGFVDKWQSGDVANPCPSANHYGGRIDAHRAESLRWVRIKCQVRTRNMFYDSRRKSRVVHMSLPGYRE